MSAPLPISDAKQRERDKNELARAQDISYTINHFLMCTAADVFSAPINAGFQRWLGSSPVGCNNPNHHHTNTNKRGFWSYMGHVAPAEIISDIGAVPFTILIQRTAPGFMHGLNTVLEPLFGDLFRMGANASSKVWAKKNGLDPEGPEARAKARSTYGHEVDHLGQAAVWTASAFGLNVGIQRMTETFKPPVGGPQSWGKLIASKGLGSTVSSAALIGLRGFGPAAAENWDDWTSKHIFIPATRKVSQWIGLSDEAIKDFEKKEHEDDKHWDHLVAKAKEKKAAETPAALVSDVAEHSVQKAAPALGA